MMEESQQNSNFEFEGTINSLFKRTNLKWIFVGGKGGVGKTTTSSAIAILAAEKLKKRTLIISTDPAHNLSDCFDQKFSKEPLEIKAFESKNLFGMEVDPKMDAQKLSFPSFMEQPDQTTKSLLSELISSIPGIDEAMAFGELVRIIDDYKFDLVIFDTAPTGHTLRLLNFPTIMEKGLDKIFTLKQKIGGIVNTFAGAFGVNQSQMETQYDQAFANLDRMKKNVEKVNNQLKDKVINILLPQLIEKEKTTFVCVCIPEFLSVYETERLLQSLAKFDIESSTIIVNQIVFPDNETKCKQCKNRYKMQKKYLEQIQELYDDFHIVFMPQQETEVRGSQLLINFGNLLLQQKKLPQLDEF